MPVRATYSHEHTSEGLLIQPARDLLSEGSVPPSRTTIACTCFVCMIQLYARKSAEPPSFVDGLSVMLRFSERGGSHAIVAEFSLINAPFMGLIRTRKYVDCHLLWIWIRFYATHHQSLHNTKFLAAYDYSASIIHRLQNREASSLAHAWKCVCTGLLDLLWQWCHKVPNMIMIDLILSLENTRAARIWYIPDLWCGSEI